MKNRGASKPAKTGQVVFVGGRVVEVTHAYSDRFLGRVASDTYTACFSNEAKRTVVGAVPGGPAKRNRKPVAARKPKGRPRP